ncbi:DUF445 domain-containing protein [Clostridium sp.]|uniref:DUF445 domain-containing protein n=1 Tax=Clostridium sp. TaxID=1506 RepID=UPI0028469927|nr:DUF445 domain-containing protein [Clostridium sp.]MDR3597414.1 DUF445 domain-containing protein [Clostridium sp.]
MKIKTNQKALISLIIMIIGFMGTLFSDNVTIIMILQSGFEAGLVGGLADWFAVTALFRYPLGIKIPHTALLPNNRTRITMALVSIVENNLLNKSSILNKIQQFNIVERTLKICKRKIYSKEVKSRIIYIIRSGISNAPITKISSYLYELIGCYLNTFDTKNFLEVLINACLKYNCEEKIVDSIINKLEEVIKREEIKKEIGNVVFDSMEKLKVNKLIQYVVRAIIESLGKDRTASLIQDLIILILKDLKKVDNSNRVIIVKFIRNNISNISDNTYIVQKIDDYKNNLTSNVKLNDFILKTLNEMQSLILSYVNDDNYIEANIIPLLENLIDKSLANADLINKLEGYIQEQASDYINNNHEKIGKLVKENIERLDTKSLIELIEYKVGDDLQWIRINGAICGFFIGLVLGIIKIL